MKQLFIVDTREKNIKQRSALRNFRRWTQSYEFFTGLRGFHVYSNTVNRRPYVGQKITFKREHNNPHDRFAVAGKTMLKGKIAPVTVGHVPRELARYVWYARMEGAKFEAVVHQEKEKPSPLVQGGLEIIIKMKATWGLTRKTNHTVCENG